MTAIPEQLAKPLYTLTEAARLVDLPVATLRSWARGRDFPTTSGEMHHSDALVTDAGAGRAGFATMPFVGLAEAAFLAAVKKTGVPMQRIRPALEKLRDEMGIEHALASQMLYTDGAELLRSVGAAAGASDRELELVVVRTDQGVFTPVVRNFLSHVRFGASGYAESIRLPKYGEAEVIVDPRFGFGQPVLESNGVRIDAVLDRFHAGESMDVIADDFNTPRKTVEQLIRASLQVAA